FSENPLPEQNRMDTPTALLSFQDWCKSIADSSRDILMWGNGADFDNIILGSLFEDYGYTKPWATYSNNRCFRTMNNLVKNRTFVDPGRHGVHHNALDDAITQAKQLQ